MKSLSFRKDLDHICPLSPHQVHHDSILEEFQAGLGNIGGGF